MTLKQSALLLLGILCLNGCGGSAVRTSDVPLPGTTLGSHVNIYMNSDQVGKSYKVIGVVDYYNIGKFQKLLIVSVYEGLREKARELVANGVIIDEYHTIYSGIISRGVSATGRAIITK